MKNSHIDPSSLLDRLEKKYAKKLQIQKLKKQSKYQKQTLMKVRGMSVSKLLGGKQSILFDNDFKFTHR